MLYALPFKCVLSLESQHTIDFCGRLQLQHMAMFSAVFARVSSTAKWIEDTCLHGGPRRRVFSNT